MIQTKLSLRDFLDEEQLRWLPSNLRVVNCILLVQNKEDEKKIMRQVVQVFDNQGTWIGEIKEPRFLPE